MRIVCDLRATRVQFVCKTHLHFILRLTGTEREKYLEAHVSADRDRGPLKLTFCYHM